MSIAIRCGSCLHEYHVNDRLAGKRVKCKQCAAAIVVSAACENAAPAAADSAIPAISALLAAPAAPAAPVSKRAAARDNPHGPVQIAAKPSPAPAGASDVDPSDSAAPAASEPAAAADPGKSSNPKPVRKRQPLSRKIYLSLAMLAIAGFGVVVYYLGREMGFWGEISRPKVVAHVLRTADQKVDYDRDLSRANLAAIGRALEMWSRFHKGMYPPRLVDVKEVVDLTDDIFQSPFASTGSSDYAYLHFRSMGVGMPRGTVIAYDPAEMAAGQGGNVLFATGDVIWLKNQQIAAEIQRSENQRMGLANPEGGAESASSVAAISRPDDPSNPAPEKPKRDRKRRGE